MFFILIVLLGTPIEALETIPISGRNCSENNGGCQHYCIDRNDGSDAFCGCQCYYHLNQDNETCDVTTECLVDLLWSFDFTFNVMTAASCLGIDPTVPFPTDLVPFETWRDITASYLGALGPEIDSGSYHIATTISGRTTVIRYQYGELQNATVLQSEMEAYEANYTLICGQLSVFRELYKVISNSHESSGQLTGQRDPADAVKVAVVNMISPFDSNYVSDLQKYSAAIHQYFDQVFVISRLDDTFIGSSQASGFYEDLRWLACQNGSDTNCPYLFFVDGLNDNNVSWSGPLINGMIDRTTCISRRPIHEHTAVCGVSSITITIPICLLGGLEESDLQLNDAACRIESMSTRVGENIELTIQYDDCSWDQTIETIGSNEYLRYSQVVTRRPTGGAIDSAKVINLEASCLFLRYSAEELGPVAPIAQVATGNIEVDATFDIEFLLYPNSSYISPHSTLPSMILVSERLYFSVEAAIPDDLKLIVTDLQARNTANGSDINYDLFSNQCPIDETFQYENIGDPKVKQFSFEMFEFANTASSPNGEKDLIYLVVSVCLCPVTNTTPACTQACPARRKRDAEDNGDVVKHTRQMGPFYLGDSDIPKSDAVIKKIDEVVKPKRTDRDDILVTIEMEDPSYIEISCLWIFITLVAILVVTSITKLLIKCGQNKSAKCHLANVGEKEMKYPADIKPKL